MVKLKLKDLWDKESSLKKLFDCDIDIEVAFKAKAMRKSIVDHLERAKEVELDLFKKHGFPNKSGSGYIIPGSNQPESCAEYGITPEEAEKRYAEIKKGLEVLLEEEVDLDILNIKIDQLKGSKLSVADLDGLEFIVNG